MTSNPRPSQVVLITGSSTGIGRATVQHFSAKGWTVVATMRRPEAETELMKCPGVTLAALDVTNPDSIRRAIANTIACHGRIDVVVNNAGYGLVGPFEELREDQVRKQFETNVFGLMSVCREILPTFRKQGRGRIINISSVGGRVTFPLYSAYHSTKWAVEGFTESLQYELAPLGIRTILVEPGPIRTDFYERSAERPSLGVESAYRTYFDRLMSKYDRIGARAVGAEVVARVIVQAASSPNPRLRYAVGGSAPLLLFLRRFLPDRAFARIVRLSLGE